MIDAYDMPFPIRFNPLKHHRNFILDILERSSPEVIIGLLDQVSNNYIDIYTGNLTPLEIGNSVIDQLKSVQVFQEDDFSQWLDLKNGYRQINLEDQSVWIIRRSNETAHYIHLHPAHTGPLTVRFKGSSLKTVYLLENRFKGVQETFKLEEVNRIRVQAGLSPVKKLDRNKGILKCYERFINGFGRNF